MALKIFVTLFALVSLWNIAEANVGKFTQLKLFNRNFRASYSEVQDMLKKADLESHGYSKEVTTKLVKGPRRIKPDYQKSYFYFKIVSCSRTQEIEEELDTLLSGALGDEIAIKLDLEIKTRHLDTMGQCKVGLEIDFKKASFLRKRRGIVRTVVRYGLTVIAIIESLNSGDDDDDDDDRDDGSSG